MKTISRLLAPRFFILLGLITAVPALPAATLQNLIAVKLNGYTQTGAAGNFTAGESSFDLELRFGGTVSGTSATLSTPLGNRTVTARGETVLGTLQTFADAAALESALPNGSYRVILGGASEGNFAFTFPPATLPPVAITNYAALQDVIGTSATIMWEPLSVGPVAESVVFLEIFRANGELVWRSSGLTPDSRQVTVTNLPGNQSLYGVLTYAQAPLVTADHVISLIARGTSVRFPLGTRTPPTITAQPLSQAFEGRSSVTLTVGLLDAEGTSYQWHHDGALLAGATKPSVTVTTPGFYTVTLTNRHGTTTSNAASVTLSAPSADARIYALSSRARVGTGGDVLIPGIIIGGTGQRQVLVRASGPALQNVSDKLQQPRLTLFQAGNSTPIAINTGWSRGTAAETAALQTAFAATNLPAYPPGSADCALIVTVNANTAYTATISGVDNNTTGVALVEVYELGSGSAHLKALSCRAQVGTGADILIPGLIVAGSGPKSFLVRAKGAGIEGVANVLAHPKLEIFNSAGLKIAGNAGWTNAPDVAAISAATAAAGLAPLATDAADCAILATLPPGAYTAQVSGLNGTTGVALVEVYEVP